MSDATETLLEEPAGHYRFRDVLTSEWTKLVSVRSTPWTLLVTTVLGVGLGAVVTSAQSARFDLRGPAARELFDPTRASLAGLLFAQLAIGVLAVLAVSAEYSTGTIRTTLAAVPRRWQVLAGKVVLMGFAVLVIGELVSFVAFAIGQVILTGHTPTASLGDASVLRAVLSGGLYLSVLGLFGLGLATIIRHTAAAISTYVGCLFVLPIIAAVLPASFSSDVTRYLPTQIGAVMISAHYLGTDPFGPWTGFGLLCGYAAVALATGGVLLTRRDA